MVLVSCQLTVVLTSVSHLDHLMISSWAARLCPVWCCLSTPASQASSLPYLCGNSLRGGWWWRPRSS